MSMKDLASRFDAKALLQIADAAQHNADLIVELEPKPWRRSRAQQDAWHIFTMLAAMCRATITLQQGEE